MREDDLTSRVIAFRVRDDEIHRRAGRFVRVVDCRLREKRVGVDGVRIGRMGRMDEDHRAAIVEFLPDWFEGFVA